MSPKQNHPDFIICDDIIDIKDKHSQAERDYISDYYDALSGLCQNIVFPISTDANGRFAKLDPATGAAAALAESYRNVCTAGARPLAVTDCLNVGSPEDPDAMWQLVEIITGLADACAAMGVPVTGGNVSPFSD